MNIDPELMKLLMAVGNMLGTLAVALYTYLATQDKDNSKHIKAVEETLAKAISEHTSRIDKMEAHLKFLPTQQQVSDLQGDIKAMKVMQEAAREDSRLMRTSLTRLENFLYKTN
jgi:3-hydroxyacyl-CoA dehydrogenase